MGPFIGVLSFEQYILPLLVQTIGDGEQFVVLKVLEILICLLKNDLSIREPSLMHWMCIGAIIKQYKLIVTSE